MNRLINSPILALGATMLVAGCAAPDGSVEMAAPPEPVASVQTAPVTLVMECGDITVPTRIDGESAWLFLPGETVRAEHAISASGARYIAEGVELWLKGEEGLLIQEGQPNRNCTNNRRAAIWEGAKLDGMDFRGAGNEPPWILELWYDKVVLKTGYEQARREWPRPQPITLDRASRFDLADGVSVLLEGKACSDSMSGEAFETTITITDGDRTYRGCGRALH